MLHNRKMKTCRIYSALLALILFVCLFGAQGQYNTPTSGYSARATISDMAQSTTSQYSQFYQMLSGPAPSNHIITPRKYDITGNAPSTVLFSNQGLPVNYPQYASNPIYTGRYVFSWPASRLAFGDNSILSVPKLPVSS